MKTHHFHLKEISFQLIKSGKKIIEIRLFDEKRKNISIGDSILFELTEVETIKKGVVGLHWFPSFRLLLDFYDESFFGDRKEDIYTRLQTYYCLEDEQKYGVVAIILG